MSSYRPHTQTILATIARQHPEEIWMKITQHLTFPLNSQAYYITNWLRGDYFWSEETSSSGALNIFPQHLVWQWIDADVEQRAWFAASFVPPEIRKSGWANEMLARYGNREDVRRNLTANFSTEGWTGPGSLHLENKKQKLLAYQREETNTNVKIWIAEYVSRLDRRIEHARIEEEREGF